MFDGFRSSILVYSSRVCFMPRVSLNISQFGDKSYLKTVAVFEKTIVYFVSSFSPS